MDYQAHVHVQWRSPSEESVDAQIFTPKSSTFSPKMPASLLGLTPDIPIPSIEPPAFELPHTSTQGLRTSFDNYESVLDNLGELNLAPPSNGSGVFQFGQEKELSPFTYRSLHNTTPEPTGRVRQAAIPRLFSSSESGSGSGSCLGPENISGRKPGARSALFDPASMNTAETRASSLPAQPSIPNQPPEPTRYNTNDETPPNEPYFSKDFQRALQAGKSIAGHIGNILSTCELARDQESQVYNILQTANKLSQFDAPSVCKIGIVGDSGVGKSSLINSLLDEPSLARTAGLGSACTSVVTEYQLRKRGQSAKYTIEIDRMTDFQIEEQLRELVWSYRNFHLSDLDVNGFTAEEQKALETKSNLAWDTLKAAFGSRRELTETYFKDSSDGAEERIQQQLKLWTDSIQWPQDFHESGWIGSAETLDEYDRKMEQFLTGTLWPFIKVIRIFLSSQVLKSGAILVDLPGLHDSNNIRVKAAEDYMYNCDEIFVVADITRVGTNKNVEAILQESLGRNLKNGRPSQGIALVCTKSEDLDENEIRGRFFADDRSENGAKVKLLDKIIEDAELNDELRRRDDAQEELKYLYMTARNNYIESLVLSTHAEMLGTRPLSLFCVSNKAYKKNRQRATVHDLPMKGSGIPLLRQHCHKIPAQAQFKIGYHFLTVSLKSLVQQVQLWHAGGSQETLPNDATVQRLLESLQGGLKINASKRIHAAGEGQKDILSDVMIQPMGANLGIWTKEALEISNTWNTHHAAQVARFCANYGSWGSGKVPYTEWNLELIRSMADAMSLWWVLYTENSASAIGDLEAVVLGLLDGLISQVKDFQGVSLFADTLVTKKESIKFSLLEAKRGAKARIDSIKRDASQNHHSSYIFEEMSPTYRVCMSDHGDGVTQRRLSYLRKAIGSFRHPALFRAIQSRLEKDLLELVADTTKTIDCEIKDFLTQIGSDIEILRGTEAQVLAKNGDFLERLGKVVTRVLEEMERIEGIAAQVKREAKKDGYA